MRAKLRQPWEPEVAETDDLELDKENEKAETVESVSETKGIEKKSKKSKKSKDLKPQYDSSLLQSIYRTFLSEWWISGILKLVSGQFAPES